MKRADMQRDFASLSEKELFSILGTYKEGLSHEEAKRRLDEFGSNTFEEGKRRTTAEIVFEQFKSPLVYILLIAGVATLALHEYADATVIAIVVVLNTAIGAYQEGRAEDAFERLRSSQTKEAYVVRNGSLLKVNAETLVAGDVVELQSGAAVPADIRLFEVNEFSASEAALTGEWIAVEKNTEVLEEGLRITEQANMAFKGTLVASGVARGVVVRTGTDTEVGKIAAELQKGVRTLTPFQKSIRRLARQLGIVILILTAFIFVAGLYRGESIGEMVLLSIAIAVAAIPSGLPVAVTVVLAIGLESILRRGGLIKNLVATETLGSATVIISDKTGTLTQAQMSVGSIETAGDFPADRQLALRLGVLATDAYLEQRGVDSNDDGIDDLAEWHIEGRPVERAIVRAGLEAGIHQEDLWKEFEELDFSPFASKKRYAARLVDSEAGRRIALSGSPELFFEHATHVVEDGKEIVLNSSMRDSLMARHEQLAARGTRFVAIAYKKTRDDDINHDTIFEGDLTFVGLVGLHDPLRLDVPDAIETAQAAGARVIMATGDYAGTAHTIAQKVGIATATSRIVTGEEFEAMTNAQQEVVARDVTVFARMLPRQKLRLLRLVQKEGNVVAMTGDGINDAPALVNADIGIALGSGTEVAKEAADLVLLNDSFSIIVRAIEEGRRILDNLKKIVAYLLSTAFGEIFVVGGSFVLGLPIPILPTQILWTNVVEEGFMTVAFAFEPAEEGIMERDPRDEDARSIVTPSLRRVIISIALVTGVLLILLYQFLLKQALPLEEVRTIMFAALTVDSIFYTFSLKDLHRPLWRTNIFSNKYLLFAFAASFFGMAIALVFPPLRTLLSLVPLTLYDFMIIVLVGIVNLATIELAKYWFVGRKV